MYNVGVFPNKHATALKTLSDPSVEMSQVFPIKEALEKLWLSDAHVMPYYASSEPTTRPRLTKFVLPTIEKQGDRVQAEVMFFDYDNPKHSTWTPTYEQLFVDCYTKAAAVVPWIRNWYAIYRTLNGARLVYLLEYTMEVFEYQVYHEAMTEEFNRSGLATEQGSSDWTRLYRLPKVTRDNVQQANLSWFEIAFQEDCRINPTELVSPDLRRTKQAPSPLLNITWPMPDSGVLAKLDSEAGKTWYKKAKRRLVGKECYDHIYNPGRVLPIPEGRRDVTLMRFVGQAISNLISMEETEPDLIYCLFFDLASDMHTADPSGGWMLILYDKIKRVWEREFSKYTQSQQEMIEQYQQSKGKTARMIEGVKAWCREKQATELGMAQMWEHIGGRCILSFGDKYYVMAEDGQFHAHPVSRQEIIPHIRTRGMDDVIPIEFMDEKGKTKQRSSVDIINNHSCPLVGIEAIGGMEECFVKNYFTHQPILQLPTYSRNPLLAAAYSQDVEDWLEACFGVNKHLVVNWISFSLAFEEGPICGLYIKGAPGIGKKVMSLGLQECLKMPYECTEEAFTEFNGPLLRTPWVMINEGLPQINKCIGNPADIFRRLVGGDPITVREKFKPPITVRNPCRVMFFANNDDVLRSLVGRKSLSQDDREAIGVRLLHVEARREGAEWLRRRGGIAFTGRKGARWVRPDSGKEESDFIVARHFLWLYENRDQSKRGKRLLVEGLASDTVMRELSTRAGYAPLIIETIIDMIEGAETRLQLDEENRLMVSGYAVLDHYRKKIRKKVGTNVELTASMVEDTINGISVGSKANKGRRLWVLDLGILNDFCENQGYPTRKLQKLMVAREEAKIEHEDDEEWEYY